MTDANGSENGPAPDGDRPEDHSLPKTAGEQLRAAREAADMDLTDVATRTRVPLRHLEAIERSNYSNMPTQTYAIGFARAYARAVSADEEAIAADLRVELGRAPLGMATETQPYQPADPARVPSRLLAWTALAVLAVIGIGYGIWRSQAFSDEVPIVMQPAAAPGAAPVIAPVTTPAPSTSGQVVLTATQPAWVRIYDRDRKRLFEKELAAGERYVVPSDALDPMILTARPDVLTVTIDGRAVPPLADAQVTIRDVGVSATALLARGSAASPSVTAVSPLATQPPSGNNAGEPR